MLKSQQRLPTVTEKTRQEGAPAPLYLTLKSQQLLPTVTEKWHGLAKGVLQPRSAFFSRASRFKLLPTVTEK